MKCCVINVAANSAIREVGGPGPVFPDGRFRYIPIPESHDEGDGPTYRELGLAGHVPDPDMNAHYDPEFEGPTYGDYLSNKPTLRSIKKGDAILFLASLDNVVTGKRGFYLIGWLKVIDILDEEAARSDPRCAANAHILRKDDSGYTIFVGRKGGLFKKAVPITKELAEAVFLPANKTWKLTHPHTGRTFTVNERINQLTRFPRLVTDINKVEILRRAIISACKTDICD